MNPTTKVGCWLMTWSEINVTEHRDQITFDPPADNYSPYTYTPKQLAVPEGWHVAKCKGGSLELYTDEGQHVAIAQVAAHRKSVQVAWADGTRWIALGDADEVCCPTCGHPM